MHGSQYAAHNLSPTVWYVCVCASVDRCIIGGRTHNSKIAERDLVILQYYSVSTKIEGSTKLPTRSSLEDISEQCPAD